MHDETPAESVVEREHLAKLKEGVEAWNEWRMESLESPERPDLLGADLQEANLQEAFLWGADLKHAHLQGAHLRGADLLGAHLQDANLRGADLRGANLKHATLQGADLLGANLQEANLRGADLQEAYLRRANLQGAILQGANLRGANLRDADLRGAYLRGANLRGANLQGAYLHATTFADDDLRETKGLEDVTHHGPSTIGTDALARSEGQIPDAFLRGCGLQDWEVKAAKLWDPHLSRDERTEIAYDVVNLQAESPIVLHSVFISYSRQDAPFVEKIEKGLDEKHIRYWRDIHDMKAGRVESQIDKAIRMNPIVLVVLSEHSVESDWVEWEVRKARELAKTEKRDVLCPIALDDSWQTCDWPDRLRQQVMEYLILDFSDSDGFGPQFEKLVDGIVEFYPPPEPDSAE